MKNRKRIVVAFMLVAVLMLGVGYAALTDNLTITGEATVAATKAQGQFEEDIYFSAAKVKENTGGSGTPTDSQGNLLKDTAAVGQTNNDSASFHAHSLARNGESVTFVFTIKNAGQTTYNAKISIDDGYPTNTNSPYFTCTESIDDQGIIVEAGETMDIEITVQLIKDPPENLNMAYTLNLTATSTESTNP